MAKNFLKSSLQDASFNIVFQVGLRLIFRILYYLLDPIYGDYLGPITYWLGLKLFQLIYQKLELGISLINNLVWSIVWYFSRFLSNKP